MKRMGQASHTHADNENQQLPPPPFSFSHTHGKRPRHDSKGMRVNVVHKREAGGVCVARRTSPSKQAYHTPNIIMREAMHCLFAYLYPLLAFGLGAVGVQGLSWCVCV